MIGEIPSSIVYDQPEHARLLSFVPDDTMLLESEFNDDGTVDYALTLRQQPLRADEVFYVLKATAPAGQRSYAYDVFVDLQSADDSGSSRMANHAKYLGDAWQQFMESRGYYQGLVGALPDLAAVDVEVQRITDRQSMNEYCARYLFDTAYGGEARSARTWERLAAPSNIKRELVAYASEQLGLQPIGGLWYNTEQLTHFLKIADPDIFDSVAQVFEEASDEFVGAVVLDAMRFVMQLGDRWWFERWMRRGRDEYETPAKNFTENFAIQVVRDGDEHRIIPYRITEKNSFGSEWVIPAWAHFEQSTTGVCDRNLKQSGPYHRAHILHTLGRLPTYMGELVLQPQDVGERQPTMAVLQGSRIPSSDTPLTQAQIRWRKNADGSRTLTLGEQETLVRGNRVVSSGLMGVLLLLTLQPEVKATLSKSVTLPYSKAQQTMGAAQVPVLALGKVSELSRAEMLGRVEYFAAL